MNDLILLSFTGGSDTIGREAGSDSLSWKLKASFIIWKNCCRCSDVLMLRGGLDSPWTLI